MRNNEVKGKAEAATTASSHLHWALLNPAGIHTSMVMICEALTEQKLLLLWALSSEITRNDTLDTGLF